MNLQGHFDHQPRDEKLAILHFNNRPMTELHRIGCRHATRADEIGPEIHPAEFLADDWVHVAPCARA